MKALKVGDRLWCIVYSGHRGENQPGYEVVVIKIGRRWAKVSRDGVGEAWRREDRIDLADWTIDGGEFSSPGRCWESRASYEIHVAAREPWRALRSKLPREPPEGVDVAWIEAAAAKLG